MYDIFNYVLDDKKLNKLFIQRLYFSENTFYRTKMKLFFNNQIDIKAIQ